MEEKEQKDSSIKEYIPYFVILISILLIKTFIVTPVKVNGESMEKTLQDKDIMLLDKISYKFSEIKRFDIVVIDYQDEYLIKRIIGLPGETVKYKDNKLYINGEIVKEKFSHGKTNDFEVTLPDNKYFVLGDNRPLSADSRVIGSFVEKDIVGKTALTILPFNRFGKKN